MGSIISLIILIVALVCLVVQIIIIIRFMKQRNGYKEKEALIEKYLKEQNEHYEYLVKRECETRRFREDMSKHVRKLSELLAKKQYEEFDKYLDTVDMELHSFGNMVTVNNGIVDAILNRYYAQAKDCGVTMTVKGRMPDECYIDAYDLCCVFTNVISNALEAALDSAEKVMTIDCRYTPKNIIIVARNSYKGKRSVENGKIKTRKSDMNYHGLGMENIRDSVAKYNGTVDIEVRGHEFIMTVLMAYGKES